MRIRALHYGISCALSYTAPVQATGQAWAVLGWTASQREAGLHLVVNNARFLILPWAHAPNLASCILGRAATQLPRDWRARYGHEPLLLETFVERDRFRGTCYRAANWIHVGATQGRGKLDRHMRFPVPVKDIFLYPLHRHFRRELCAAAP